MIAFNIYIIRSLCVSSAMPFIRLNNKFLLSMPIHLKKTFSLMKSVLWQIAAKNLIRLKLIKLKMEPGTIKQYSQVRVILFR